MTQPNDLMPLPEPDELDTLGQPVHPSSGTVTSQSVAVGPPLRYVVGVHFPVLTRGSLAS